MKNQTIRVLAFISFITLALFLSKNATLAQEIEYRTVRETSNLFGPIKKVTYFKGESLSVLKIYSYRDDGSLETLEIPSWRILTYDFKGRPLKNEKITPSGREITSFTTYNDSQLTYSNFSYSNNPIEIMGKLNGNGDIIETKHYSPIGEYIGYSIYEYKDGLKKTSTKFNEKGIPCEKFENIYDSKEHILEVSHYEITVKETTQYLLSSKECYIFDSQGRLFENRLYRGPSQELSMITTYSDYDNYGNWTKRTETFVGPGEIVLYPIKMRKIEYYLAGQWG